MHPCNPTCERFQEFSHCAAKAISEATQLGLLYQEETISENLLLAIARRCQNVKIKSFKRHQETKNGSDWEWWIGVGGKWLSIRIQAKKKRTNGDTFHRLLTYQAKTAANTQIDTLIMLADADGHLPAYCFYVSDQSYSTSCPSLLGCFVADAKSVKNAKSDKWAVLSKISHPWHYLVCDCKCHHSSSPAILDAVSRKVEIESLKDSLPEYLKNWDESEGAMFKRAKERKLAGFVKIEL